MTPTGQAFRRTSADDRGAARPPPGRPCGHCHLPKKEGSPAEEASTAASKLLHFASRPRTSDRCAGVPAFSSTPVRTARRGSRVIEIVLAWPRSNHLRPLARPPGCASAQTIRRKARTGWIRSTPTTDRWHLELSSPWWQGTMPRLHRLAK